MNNEFVRNLSQNGRRYANTQGLRFSQRRWWRFKFFLGTAPRRF